MDLGIRSDEHRQIVGNIERRFSQGPGSYATTGGMAVFKEDGTPSVERILSRGSFRLSPREGSGAPRWSLWGAGTVGSIPLCQHTRDTGARWN